MRRQLTISTVIDHNNDYILVDSERAAIVVTQRGRSKGEITLRYVSLSLLSH